MMCLFSYDRSLHETEDHKMQMFALVQKGIDLDEKYEVLGYVNADSFAEAAKKLGTEIQGPSLSDVSNQRRELTFRQPGLPNHTLMLHVIGEIKVSATELIL